MPGAGKAVIKTAAESMGYAVESWAMR